MSADDPEGVYPFGNKFGCSVEYGRKLLQLCRQLGLDVIGVWYVCIIATCMCSIVYAADNHTITIIAKELIIILIKIFIYILGSSMQNDEFRKIV